MKKLRQVFFFFRLMVLFGFSAFIDLIRINLRKMGETCCFQFFFFLFSFFFSPVFIFFLLFPFGMEDNYPGQFFPHRLGFPGNNRNQNVVAR